jgi:hypothetical protein
VTVRKRRAILEAGKSKESRSLATLVMTKEEQIPHRLNFSPTSAKERRSSGPRFAGS